MFDKILIANRGEIALRIVRACKELGIKTVVVYSKVDRESLAVRLADEAVCIGPAPSGSSYLNIPAIISAAEITDVDALHPGYGFLAENAHFAEICESCRIKFIGPSVDNLRLMGNKALARETVQKLGIPTIPGSKSIIKDKQEALEVVKKIGYPVIIKSAGGGGGKGMRIAHNEISLLNSIDTAQAEAEASFGSPDVYIEKYIQRPRHIEFQILADNYGNIIHLGERDCTIQRRHQKLIEEAPSLRVDKELREKMGRAAVKCAKSIGYKGAGTVEFLLDEQGNYYFIEMNTRIQVEHPITEMVSGIDLLKEQIRIAAGERLRYQQKDIEIKGWAIECRINAEDWEKDFSPSPGRIEKWIIPGGRGVRVDTAVYPGCVIPPYYDSLIAKLITYGKTREEAILIMRRALEEFVIDPIKTTLPLYKEIFASEAFWEGKFHTQIIEELLQEK
ncbi:MAG: acetyl-CoA carboxylase biotin carboxylase subunit [Candidatus Omnitrophota bacterium]|nr:MAG: acetyl-CoA carboxylase biotin carboxylase subunit [Candidatus Omnitrophota bacterium]